MAEQGLVVFTRSTGRTLIIRPEDNDLGPSPIEYFCRGLDLRILKIETHGDLLRSQAVKGWGGAAEMYELLLEHGTIRLVFSHSDSLRWELLRLRLRWQGNVRRFFSKLLGGK